jgi:hypothetical protein
MKKRVKKVQARGLAVTYASRPYFFLRGRPPLNALKKNNR